MPDTDSGSKIDLSLGRITYPVSTDTTELPGKAAWVLSHAAEAKRIGEAGRALSEAITYECAAADAMPTIQAAIQFGSEQELTARTG